MATRREGTPLRGRAPSGGNGSAAGTPNWSAQHVSFAHSPERSIWSDSSSHSGSALRSTPPGRRGPEAEDGSAGRRRSAPRDVLAAVQLSGTAALHSRLSDSLASELSIGGGELVLGGTSPEAGASARLERHRSQHAGADDSLLADSAARSRRPESRLSSGLRDSLDDDAAADAMRSSLRAPESGREGHDGNDASGSDQEQSIGWGASSMQTHAPVPSWAVSAWQRREDSARRKFRHQVIGSVARDRESAHSRLLNASGAGAGGTMPDATPASLRSSRLEILARSRAETIGDTSAGTSDASFQQAARDRSSAITSAGAHRNATSPDASSPFLLSHMSGVFSAASGEFSSSSLLARWHAREKREVCCRYLVAWHVYTYASLQSLARIFRSRWASWRQIVTALSARRRLAVYVLSTRQRLSNALEIWVSLRVKNRALARLGWLHTGKVLTACVGALRANINRSRAFKSVANSLAKIFHAVILQMHSDVWRRQVFVSRHSNERRNIRSQHRIIRTLHAWLAAISQTRANVVTAEWKASEQRERILRRCTRLWRASAEVSSDVRVQLMFKAFRRLKRQWDFGRYRDRRLCAMARRQEPRTKRWAFAVLLKDYLQNVFALNASHKVQSVVSRRILNECISGWRYLSWRTRRVARLQRRLRLHLCADALQFWNAAVKQSWRLDIKETQLLESVTARCLCSFFGRWLYSSALGRKARHRQQRVCTSRVALVFHNWRIYMESVHVNRHREQLIALKSNTRRKQKTFWELTKWHDLRLALAVDSFRARLWARNVLLHTFKHWCMYISQQKFDHTVLINLKNKNEETRQAQAIAWWCQRHRQTKFKLSIVAALRFASIGRHAWRAWSESCASRARHQRFVFGIGHKLHRAARIAAVSYTWLLWWQAVGHRRATRRVVNVGNMQLWRFAHELFACWTTEAVVGHKERIKVVQMQVSERRVFCCVTWHLQLLLLLTDSAISCVPVAGFHLYSQVDTRSPDSIQACPSDGCSQIAAVYA